MTIDAELSFRAGEHCRHAADDVLVIETKSANGNGLADKILRALHQHPTNGCSKYCVGMAALQLGLEQGSSLSHVRGEAVDLGFVDMPVLNIYAEQDHLVPPEASKALGGLVGSKDYSELSFRGGHIGIYVSSRAQREVPQAIHDWLSARSR